MAENRLIEALNHCIDMLAEGKTIDECISRYPQYADQLRGMLMTGQVTKQGKLPVHEIVAARARIDPAIKGAIESFTPAATATGAATSTLPFSPLAMVASTIVVFIAVGLIIVSSNGNRQFATPSSEMTLTVDASPE